MAKSIEPTDLSILLVQIRDHGAVRNEEVESFERHGGLRKGQLDILNVFDTPEFEPDRGLSYDAVLVGGASEASVLEPDAYPFVPRIVSLLNMCIAHDVPVFASCFGFQAAALGLGAAVVRDEADFEMGTIPLNLASDAENDPIFRDIPNGFLAVSCHRERVNEVPPGCIKLAYTEHCLHAFRVRGKAFWAFQFHPELDRDCFVQRLGIYQDSYTESESAYASVASSFKETPESNQLLKRFLAYIVQS